MFPECKVCQSWEIFVGCISVPGGLSRYQTPPQLLQKYFQHSLMAPYDFDAPDADAILRSSDGKELRVHRIILSLASPVFQGMFGLPQPTEPPSQIPSVDVPEPSGILQPFIQYLYPRSPPKVSGLAMWAALYAVADKYDAEVVVDLLRDMLILASSRCLHCVSSPRHRIGVSRKRRGSRQGEL